jgi:hypothetical protein
MTPNTGGPAFPAQVKFFDEPTTGMTLRDYFAAKAMQSVFTSAITEGITLNQDIDCDKLAMIAYVMADAMLHEREGK